VLRVLLFILPKVGPLSLANVKGPTNATEADYMHSVYQSAAALRYALRGFTPLTSRLETPQATLC